MVPGVPGTGRQPRHRLGPGPGRRGVNLVGAAGQAAVLGRRQGGQRDEVAGEGAQELGLLLRHPTLTLQ